MSTTKKTSTYGKGQRDFRGNVTVKPGSAAKKCSRKSGKQMLKELPIASLSPAKQKQLLLDLIDTFRQGIAHEDAGYGDIYREAVIVFSAYDVDLLPDDV